MSRICCIQYCSLSKRTFLRRRSAKRAEVSSVHLQAAAPQSGRRKRRNFLLPFDLAKFLCTTKFWRRSEKVVLGEDEDDFRTRQELARDIDSRARGDTGQRVLMTTKWRRRPKAFLGIMKIRRHRRKFSLHVLLERLAISLILLL